jgi:hypothetical protein
MKRHPFRWDALIFGLVFLAVVGIWLTQTTGLLTSGQLAYALAGALIAVGAAGIVASFATQQNRLRHPTDDVHQSTTPIAPAAQSDET